MRVSFLPRIAKNPSLLLGVALLLKSKTPSRILKTSIRATKTLFRFPKAPLSVLEIVLRIFQTIASICAPNILSPIMEASTGT